MIRMIDNQEQIKNALQPVIREQFHLYRKEHHLSQDRFARLLRISVRSYIDLEHGVTFPSATTLLLFLLQLEEQDLLCFLSTICAAISKRH